MWLKIKRQFSATSLPCSWLPANFKFVLFSTVADIDFKTSTQKRKMTLRNEATTCEPKRKSFTTVPPEDDDLTELYSQLSTTSGKPVMLSHTE